MTMPKVGELAWLRKQNIILQNTLCLSRIECTKTAMELRDLLARLPHTRDGVVIIPLMECYRITEKKNIRPIRIECIKHTFKGWFVLTWDGGYEAWDYDEFAVSDLYSTRAVAEKALKERK